MRNTIVALALFACAMSASAAKRSVLFYWENDSLGSPLGQGTDDDYTNGLRLVIGTAAEPRWGGMVRRLCERFDTGCGQLGSTSAYGFTHQFYTPKFITLRRPQPLDRPWAGTMYLSAHMNLSDEDRQHSIEGQLGILGQGAGAQYVQSKWHQLIGSPNNPAGWHHQLKNEPLVNLTYGYTRRFHTGRDPAIVDAFVNPGFAVGTLVTYPSLGGTVRAGWHPSAFPKPPIQPDLAPMTSASDGKAPPKPTSCCRTELYVMAGADVRYVLHNSTLDGGFFRDGPSVDRTPLVHDLRLGFSGRLDSFRITYSYVMRSKEFAPPPGRDGKHNYHSLAVSWEPR